MSWALVERHDEGGRGRHFGRLGVAWPHDSLRYHRASPLQVETQRSNEVRETTRRGIDNANPAILYHYSNS